VLVLALALSTGCGSSRQSHETTTPSGSRVATLTYPTPQQLPYDSEENAFIVGCLHQVYSQSQCDCVYRELRSEGHAASQLAALGPDLTSGASGGYGGAPMNYGPPWFGHATALCETGGAS
jgi:hypothetical protein